jgi:hypothetical protein
MAKKVYALYNRNSKNIVSKKNCRMRLPLVHYRQACI